MYAAHFGLRDIPFEPLARPKNVFPSQSIREAVDHFFYARDHGEGFVLLIGEAGVGKSVALGAIAAGLPPETPVAVLRHPTLRPREAVEEIVRRFGVDTTGVESKAALLGRLEKRLTESLTCGRKAVLIVDEVHVASRATLEDIRLLSNMELEGKPLIQICLVGQPEIAERLRSPRMRQLRQRISVRCQLEPLSLNETSHYLAHRLREAGSDRMRQIFTSEAVKEIHRLTGGLPREINIVAGQSMMNAYVDNRKTVRGQDVSTVQHDFGFEGTRLHRDGSEKRELREPEQGVELEPRDSERERAILVDDIPVEPSESSEDPHAPLVDRVESHDFTFAEIERPTWRRYGVVTFIVVVVIGVAMAAFWPGTYDIEEMARLAHAQSVESYRGPSPTPDAPAGVFPPETETPTFEPSDPDPATVVSDAPDPEIEMPEVPESRAPSTPDEPVRSANVVEDPPRLTPLVATPPEDEDLRREIDAVNALERGSYLAEAGQLPEAIVWLRRAVALCPDCVNAHYNLGTALLSSGDEQEAIVELERAVALSPSSAASLRNLGLALRAAGRPEDAVERLQQVAEMTRRDPALYEQIGIILSEIGRHAAAVDAFRMVSSLAPTNERGFQRLGLALRETGRHEEALEAFRRAAALNPDSSLNYQYLGLSLTDTGRHEGAVAALRRSAELSPDDALVHHNLGYALMEIGRWEESIAELRKAVELDPQFALAYYNQALALRGAGRDDEAEQAMQMAVSLGFERE